MWPFRRERGSTVQQTTDRAIELAALRWQEFARSGAIPGNVNLRDRVTFFAAGFRDELTRRYPLLGKAPDELVLLIIAEGIMRSGLESRRLIELQLGIVLPAPAD